MFAFLCFPDGLSAKDAPGNVADKVKELTNSKPPVETPSGTQPAEPANPGQNPAQPAEPGNPGKPDVPSNPSDPVKPGNPPEQTPSGTQPAEPANPGENPAQPAEPGNPGENPAKPADPANPGETPAKPADPANPDKSVEPGDKGQPEDGDKSQKDKDTKDAKDKKDKKNKPGKGGKSGGPSAPSLPSGVPTPPSGAALAPVVGGIGGGIIGGLFSGGKKEAKEEKKEIPKPALKAAVSSSETVKAAAPAPVSTETAKVAVPVQVSTPAAAVEPLYSAGKGPKIAVMDFDGETGAEFAALLSKALSADLKVYNPKELAAKEYDATEINRVSARKIAAETAVEYIITGKVSKKSETLSIISVFLRDGKTGDIKLTHNHSLRSAGDLGSAAETASVKIKERVEK